MVRCIAKRIASDTDSDWALSHDYQAGTNRIQTTE